jgi:hypothetical protein
MRAYNSNRGYTTQTKTFLPVLPLVRLKLDPDTKDKASYITFELKIRTGTGQGTPSYKKFMKTFEEGSPQEWMDVLTGLREIWRQNSVNGPTDRAATVAAILKGDSLIAFESAMEDARTNPEPVEGEEPALIPMNLEHVESSLRAVTDIVFPFRALVTQKRWMSRHMKKPYDLSVKKFATALSRINNYLPYFPEATIASKYTEEELVELMEFALPNSWRRDMDLKGFVVKDNDKEALIKECERLERNQAVQRNDRDDDNRKHKKTRFANPENNNKKNERQRGPSTDGPFFCTECGPNKNHNTNRCFKIKNREAREANGTGKPAYKQAYSKRTFRKEVNAMARRAGKFDGLKIVEQAIQREQGKLAKQPAKKHVKLAVAKKPKPDDSDSSDESMHNLEARIPRKKKFVPKNVRYNSRAEIVAIESSDSEDDRKMPAKITKKRAHKNEPMDTDSSSESDSGDDNKATEEEQAFLRAINRKEKKAKKGEESE